MLFEKFGEFDSAEELNRAAAAQLAEGDIDAIYGIAEENGIDREDAEDYIDGAAPELCTPIMAALGKLKVEAAELEPQEIMEDWLTYIRIQCAEHPETAEAVRKKEKSLRKGSRYQAGLSGQAGHPRDGAGAPHNHGILHGGGKMIAYKGFAPDFTASFGSGKKQYHVGDVLEEDSSKTARTGMHCAEYVLDCLRWYPLGNGNRYCQVEARGSIDEDGSVQIACTKMNIVRELNTKQIASAACMYMVSFPERDWKRKGRLLDVAEDAARGQGAGAIAIARGKDPKVKGAAGSVLALLKEPKKGQFEAAKVFEVGGDILPDVWYTIKNGKVVKSE